MKKWIKFDVNCKCNEKNEVYLTRRKKMKKRTEEWLFRKRKLNGLKRIISKRRILVIQFIDACVPTVLNYCLTVCCGIRNLYELYRREILEFGKLIHLCFEGKEGVF
jgi:hypothetical protein